MSATTETKEITNSENVIDVRDIIARVEELESDAECQCGHSRDYHQTVREDEQGSEDCEHDGCGCSSFYFADEDERDEFKRLTVLLDELRGNGGDHDWRGDWYPVILVRDSYFEDFAREEAESLDLIKSDARWPYTCIDWKKAARELQMDYSTSDFDGVDYYYR
jgi:hypothetical protein